MIVRYANVCFSIDAEKHGVDPEDDNAVIELLRSKLESQPFEWTLESYSNEQDLGKEEVPA